MRFCLFFFVLIVSTSLSAQTAFDALRYSVHNIESTARNSSVGGAMSGLGADFTALSTNPAGLGAFRFSEWTFTPTVFTMGAKSNFENAAMPNTEKARKNRFALPEIGMVRVETPESGNWYTSNFGIGYIQLNNFGQDFMFSGESRGSIIDRFQDQANAEGFSDFESGIAYDAGALYGDNGGAYTSDFALNPNAQIFKSQLVERRGSQGELTMGFGGNYRERFLIGFTVGVPLLSYSETKNYRERDNNSSVPFFENLEFTESLETSGVGFNAKFGVLFMPTRQFRFGGAIHSPTGYVLTDNFDTAFSYTYTNQENVLNTSSQASPAGTFNYQLRTPWRYFANAGYILGRKGFLTAEAEYVNHGRSKFNASTDSTTPDDITYLGEITADVRDRFQSTLNLRVGTELALNTLRLRGGIGLGTSPYVGEKAWSRRIGMGVGYRKNRFFLDLAYRIFNATESYAPYLLSGDLEPSIENKFTDQRFVITFGFKQD